MYTSDAFTVTENGVQQGEYSAWAVSDSQIVSNYRSGDKGGLPRHIQFKLSVNGGDNERPPFQDHHLYVYPERQPGNEVYQTPVFIFGADDPEGTEKPESGDEFMSQKEIEVNFRVDFSQALSDFESSGYTTFHNGDRLNKDDFEGLYIAGGAQPLSWDFGSLPNRPDLELKDPDGDGIYEVKLTFSANPHRSFDADGNMVWNLEEDISGWTAYQAPSKLVTALYNLSLEEMIQDVRDDGAFMACAEWPGVWTRDISYSIVLAFAAINPEASKASLRAKVRDGFIIQDTGTGGAWPVSTDRMTWALAAWEIFKVTGDQAWLEEVYPIIAKSAEADLETIFNSRTGLARGESSFLDWREQTYPRWMEPKDIFMTETLGTNVVHFKTYRILADMAGLLGEDGAKYRAVADQIG